MKSTQDEEKDKIIEIEKIINKLKRKYSEYNIELIKIIAESLYNNGIDSSKLKESYYNPPFYLEEIIEYFVKQYNRENKIISASFSPNKSDLIEKSKTEIIPFQMKEIEPTLTMKYHIKIKQRK